MSRASCGNNGYSGRNEFNLGYNYRDVVLALLDSLAARGDVDVELISHANASGADRTDDDGSVADTLVERYPGFTRVPRLRDAGWRPSRGSAVWTCWWPARMHACIAAYSAGVPVVPMSYSRKFEGLFGTLGYDALVPHTGVGTEDATAILSRAVADPAALKARMATGETIIAARLEAYRALLREVFAEAM